MLVFFTGVSGCWFLPVFLVIVINFIVISTLRKQKTVGETGSKLDKKKKATVCLMAVSLTFVLLLLPGIVVQLTGAVYSKIWGSTIFQYLADITSMLATVNNAVNMYIYAAFGGEIQVALKRLLCKVR